MKSPDRIYSSLLASVLALLVGSAHADAPFPDAEASAHAASAKPVRTKKERNALLVDPTTAVRETPLREVVLPGVLTIAGESRTALDFTRTRVVSMSDSTNAAVYLSSNSDNRIQLPFTNPFIRSNSDLNIEVNKGVNGAPGNFIYVGFNVKRPVQIFIEPPDGSASLGLRLIPKDIPSQTIVVEDVTGITSADLRRANKSNDYVTQVQSLMEVVALHGIPNGYSVVDMELPPIAMNGLVVDAKKKFSNRTSDIYLYQVTNPGPAVANLNEREFDGDLVQAVSVFPKPRLAAGETTDVMVMSGKPKVGSALLPN